MIFSKAVAHRASSSQHIESDVHAGACAGDVGGAQLTRDHRTVPTTIRGLLAAA